MAWQLFGAGPAAQINQPLQSISAIQMAPLGSIVEGFEPQLGWGEFVYTAGVAGVLAGDLVTWNSLVPSLVRGSFAANAGLSIGVAVSPLVAGNFGWVQISGAAVVGNNATAAAGPAFTVAAAATISSAIAVGRQILGANILTANGSTFNKAGNTVLGSDILTLQNLDGIFVGCPISGTGIPGGASIVAGLDSQPFLNWNQVKMSAVATASGAPTVTFTRTNFSIVQLNRPHLQSQIT